MENQKQNESPKVFMNWQTPAYRRALKSKGWYLFMGLLLTLFIAYDLYTGGYIVSITFLILAGVYYLSELKPVPVVTVVISELGVGFGPQFLGFDQLQSFWILNTDIRSLHLKTHKGVIREVSIPIADEINIAALRDFLKLQIPEEEGKKESFSDQLIRNLGL